MNKSLNSEIVLFDLDGTLANVEDRVHHLHGERQNWKAFFEALDGDAPIEPVISFYKKLWDHTDYEIFILTGRPEKYREKTIAWFKAHNIPIDTLLMRPAGDNRHDYIVKEEILKKLQADGHEIAFVVEDRNSVVEMWRRNNILCLQCYEGNF
jgi:FMN phosphatase YigB (HAD superfamily)